MVEIGFTKDEVEALVNILHFVSGYIGLEDEPLLNDIEQKVLHAREDMN